MPYDENLVAMGDGQVEPAARFQITRNYVYIDVFRDMTDAQNDDDHVITVAIPRHEWQRWIDGAPSL
jgi:hypothetical protein